MKAPVTLLDVARAAGVSKSTAANVFSRPEKVRPELKARVEAAARELNYSGPDARGRLLSSGRANAIGVVAPADAGFSWVFHEHPFVLDFLTGVAEVCEERSVNLTLISARNEDGSNGVGAALVDGIILGTPAQVRLIDPGRRQTMPVVLLDSDGGEDMSSIAFDVAGGVRRLVSHLVGLGHRHFAFCSISREISGPILSLPGDGAPGLKVGYEHEWQAYRGAEAALAEVGLSMADMPLIEACGTAEELRDFGDFSDLLLDNLGPATAIVAFFDGLAVSILKAAEQRGIEVPEQLSVASLADALPPATTGPALTCGVRCVSPTERGRIAAQMLFTVGPPQHLLLPIELVVGGTTGPARA